MTRLRRRMRFISQVLLGVVLSLATVSATRMAGSATEDDGSIDQVRCWKVENGASGSAVVATYTGEDACAVSIEFPLVSSRMLPNETIPVFWTVRLSSTATAVNSLGMKVPPTGTVTLSTDHIGETVQIAETYARVCSARDQCNPTVAPLYRSASQSGNFSTTGGSVLFQSANELSIPTEGSYVVAAQMRVVDAENLTVSYYYTVFSDLAVATNKKKNVKSSQSALATTLLASESIVESDSCELQVVVQSPDVTQPNTPMAINWTATLTRDTTKEIRLPTPLTVVDVNSDGKYYEIVSSTVSVCMQGTQCDEYSSSDGGILGSTGASVLFGNFTNNVASFSLSNVTLPSTGTYNAFAHIVMAGPNTRRFDFTTYFQVVVTAENAGAQVSSEAYVMNGQSFYCYEVVGEANDTSSFVATSSVIAMAKNRDCPYSVEMSLSAASTSLSEAVTVGWQVKERGSYSETVFSDVNLTTVYDSATGANVNLAQSAIYYCSNTTAVCTPFTSTKALAYAANATNFSADGTASFSANISFPAAGNYTLFAHAVMPNGDVDRRFDGAAFGRIQVVAPVSVTSSGGSSTTGTILGVVAGVVGAVLLVFFATVWIRRRMAQRRRSTASKVAVFGFRSHTIDSPEGELRTHSRESNVSDASGSFMYVKAAPSPVEHIRPDSLSYDPYSRPSFTELSMDDGANYTFALPDDIDDQQQQCHQSSSSKH
ncbi:hypothetical protein FI667_g4740, partial [Globisporangium splendens]